MKAQSNVRRPLWVTPMAFAALVLMFSATSLARLPAAPADGLTKHFTGEIVGIQSESIMLVDAAGEDHAFSLGEDVMILLNDTEASLDMLHAGLLATVHAESRGGEWVAVSIHARTQY